MQFPILIIGIQSRLQRIFSVPGIMPGLFVPYGYKISLRPKLRSTKEPISIRIQSQLKEYEFRSL